ncbi:MAG: S8 family serine peptidase [Bacteroidetes bacterium]|nr:S8 family serine peptidase [Bacteroidota bacterium]
MNSKHYTKLSLLTLALCLSCFIQVSQAQITKYWIRFTDKNGSPFSVSNPTAFLSPKSVQRRTNQGISVDMTDIPVNQTYINQVNATGATVLQRSRWHNAAIVLIPNTTVLNAVNSLTCVLSSAPVGRVAKMSPDVLNTPTVSVQKLSSTNTTGYNYGPAYTQVNQIGADCLHNLGYRGQNMTIAIIDDGFNQADVNQVFDSLRNESRILGTYDFVAGNTSVYEDDSHGAMVLSCIAGNTPGQLIGTGPKAKVWLFRSEDATSEKIIEECNWVIAAEYADSVGADICTTSLGYTTFDISSQNHTYADLNGKTSVASIAATMAVRKGMFMLNAAGNEGGGSWNFVGVPADADSICTVGSVNSGGLHSSFSSVGPTADGRIKPDVSTMGEGTYVCGPGFNFFSGNGTSFACPVAAGAVACLWQAHPSKTNMQILQAIKATASKSSNPDNQYGWGIPNFCAAHNYLQLNTGIDEQSVHSVRLFPNPANNKVQFTLNETVSSVTMTDVLGHTVAVNMQEQNNTYTLSFGEQIPAGVYFLTIRSDSKQYTTRFVKQ